MHLPVWLCLKLLAELHLPCGHNLEDVIQLVHLDAAPAHDAMSVLQEVVALSQLCLLLMLMKISGDSKSMALCRSALLPSRDKLWPKWHCAILGYAAHENEPHLKLDPQLAAR